MFDLRQVCIFVLHEHLQSNHLPPPFAASASGCPALEEIRMLSRIHSILLVWMVLFVGTVSAAFADELTRSVTTRHLTVHYGVVPASHAPKLVSGSSPDAAHNVNLSVLTVALVDRSNGERIGNAHVMAVVKGPRSEASHLHAKPTTKPLDPAWADGTVTYSNMFDMRWGGIYHIELLITRKGETHPERVRFNIDQQF
nr:hypothetical protein [Paraburkholderia rhizosphaerae]